MARCAACGSENASRWYFYRTDDGLIATCSRSCRDAYLAGETAPDEAVTAKFELVKPEEETS